MNAGAGYDFVPLPSAVRRVGRDHVRHDRRVDDALFGRIELTYRCDQPVHVGSGFKTLADGRVVRAMVRSGDALVVPGSSMKGALRARFEAITKSCVPQGLPGWRGTQTKKRGLSRTHHGVTRAVLEPPASNHDVFRTACSDRAMCLACALFGFQQGRKGYRGRITVTDFAPVQGAAAAALTEMPSQWEPRLHHCAEPRDVRRHNDTFHITGLRGRKFHRGRSADPEGARQLVELLPAGTLIRGEIRLFNVLPEELGGILAAAGFEPGSLVKVGAGKGLGFGRLVPHAIEWKLRDAHRRDVTPAPPRYREAFVACADRHPEGEEALVAMHVRGDT